MKNVIEMHYKPVLFVEQKCKENVEIIIHFMKIAHNYNDRCLVQLIFTQKNLLCKNLSLEPLINYVINDSSKNRSENIQVIQIS